MEQLTFKQHCDLGIQHVFDFVVNHLLTQKQRSAISIRCLYRYPDGNLSCAIGCLISDHEYDEDTEHTGIRDLPGNFPAFEFLLANQYEVIFILLNRLQLIHDNDDVAHWEDQLKDLGQQYKLDFNPPIFDMNPYGLYFLQVTPTITAITDGLINYRKVMFVTGFKTGGCTKHQTLESGAKHQIMGYSYQFFKKAATISGLEEFTFDNLTRIYKQE